MKILITGVAGFIGSNLAKRLVANNHKVIGIDNLSYGSISNIEELQNNVSFEFILGDAANPFTIKEIKADIIVHLASQKIPRYTSAYRTLEENQILLKNVIEKAKRDKIRIVFASTSDVYGKNPVVPFSEESDLVLGPTTVKRWAYALSKIYGEHLLISNKEEFGLEYTITRFFGSYGPNHNLTWWGGPQSVFITKAYYNEYIEIHGDGKQQRTFTYIDDTTMGIEMCIVNEQAKNEIFNIGADASCETSIEDLATLIWKLVKGKDSKPLLQYIPYSTFGKYEDVMRRIPDITKMKTFFGYIPQWSLENGLKKTIEWQLKRI